MKLKFKLTFKRGNEVVATVVGIKETEGEHITIGELEQIVPLEQYLERLLGLRVHVEQEVA